MDTKLTQIIGDLGLKENYAKVYLAALELGGAEVANIANQAGVGRAHTYYILRKLLHQGLASLSERDNKLVYVASSPKRLLSRFESNIDQFKTVLPQLLSIENSVKNKPVIRFFEGKEGLSQILEDMLETTEKGSAKEREILEYVSPDGALASLKEPQLRFIKQRIQKKIKLRWIAPDTPLAREFLKTAKQSYREMRLVPADRFSLLTEMNIYGDKMNLIAEKGAEVGVIIEHPEIAKTQREIFELAWLGAATFNR